MDALIQSTEFEFLLDVVIPSTEFEFYFSKWRGGEAVSWFIFKGMM